MIGDGQHLEVLSAGAPAEPLHQIRRHGVMPSFDLPIELSGVLGRASLDCINQTPDEMAGEPPLRTVGVAPLEEGMPARARPRDTPRKEGRPQQTEVPGTAWDRFFDDDLAIRRLSADHFEWNHQVGLSPGARDAMDDQGFSAVGVKGWRYEAPVWRRLVGADPHFAYEDKSVGIKFLDASGDVAGDCSLALCIDCHVDFVADHPPLPEVVGGDC